MRALEPHTSLARFKIEFDHRLDDAFKVDLKKTRILMDEGLQDYLKNEFMGAPLREAEKKYRKGKKVEKHEESKDAHHDSNVLITTKEDEITESKKEIINKETGETEITNKEGTTKVILKIAKPQDEKDLRIFPVDSIEDGVLWEPILADGKTAVNINTSHRFYDRVYVPNHNESVTIQGLDALLWSLAEAEYSTLNENTKRQLESLRYEVSKILRELTSELPES